MRDALSLPAILLDLNVVISVSNGELLEEVFRLPYSIIVSDTILKNLPLKLKNTVTSKSQIAELMAEDTREIIKIGSKYEGISTSEIITIIQAKKLKAVFITGEEFLRKIAIGEAIQSYETLWILDQLLHHRIIQNSTARAALSRMMTTSPRISAAKAHIRMEAWKGTVTS